MSKARDLADLAKNANDRLDDVATSDGALSNRNLIINGAMQVAQRGTQTNQTGHFTACDRFQFVENGSVEVTTSQDTDVPSGKGFANSLKIAVSQASGAVSAGNYALVRTLLEGQDLQHLLYGTSGAKKLTLSFWVKSPKAGTHIVELIHSNAQYFNCISYTVNTADTWEHKSVIFDGYQTTNFDNDNARSVDLRWWLMAGSNYSGGTLTDNTWHNVTANQAVGQVNVMDSTSNNFYLTGVQLEVGDTATPFEHRSYGYEESLCQRYFQTDIRMGYYLDSNTGDKYLGFSFPTMRVAPTATRTRHSITSKEGGTIIYIDGNNHGYVQRNSSVSAWAIGGVYDFDAEL